jgi:hypothetical protein
LTRSDKAPTVEEYLTSLLRPEYLTEQVVGLARRVWADRRLDLMPILADALEDAGCTSAVVLQLFRCFPNNHVYTPAHAILLQLLVSNLGDLPECTPATFNRSSD